MKLSTVLIYVIVTTSMIATACKMEPKKSSEKVNGSQIKKKEIKNSKNKATKTQKSNVYEIEQYFIEKDEASNSLGDIVELNLTTTSGAMLSAYSKTQGDYLLHYRTLENNQWTNWTILHENKHVNNLNRKIFSPKGLNNTVTQIQFKSNQIIEKNVIFRIFTFENK